MDAGAAARDEEAARIARDLDKASPDSLPNQWTRMVADWAANAQDQQSLVAMKLAVRAARIKVFHDKAFRVRAAQAAKGALVVSVVAVSMAALIVSAGTAAPVVLGLHSAGLGLAGIGNIAKFSATLVEDFAMEKRILGSVTRDVLTIRQAMTDASAGRSDIAKHVTELKNLIEKREDAIRQLKVDTLKSGAEAKHLEEQASGPGAADLPGAEAARRKRATGQVRVGLHETERRIKGLEDKNALAVLLLRDLDDMAGDLSKLSTQPAETFLGNLKAWMGKPDEAAGLVATAGTLTGAASGLSHG